MKNLEDKGCEGNMSPKGRRGQFLPREFPAFPYQHQENLLVPVVMKEVSPPSSSGPKSSGVSPSKADRKLSVGSNITTVLGRGRNTDSGHGTIFSNKIPSS